MGTETPDFSRLNRLLLAPSERITLVPEGIIDNGFAVRLVPVRQGHRLDLSLIKKETLPLLDLKQAGIEPGTSATVLDRVTEMLDGRHFFIRPLFSPVEAAVILRKLGEAISVLAFAQRVEDSGPWHMRRGFDSENEFAKYATMPGLQASFMLIPVGEPLPGLLLTEPLEGFILPVCDFVMPLSHLVEGSVEERAFGAAIGFSEAETLLAKKQQELVNYASSTQRKRWFGFFNQTRKLTRAVTECRTRLQVWREQYEATLKALPA